MVKPVVRDDVVRPRLDDYDSDAGCANMLDDYYHAHSDERPSHVGEDEPKPTAAAYYDMLSSAQKPFHQHTNVSQLDAVERLMSLKSQLGIGRDGFDDMLKFFDSLLLRVTPCHATCMSQQNCFVHLRCHTSRYMFVLRDASCLGIILRMQSTVLNVGPLGISR